MQNRLVHQLVRVRKVKRASMARSTAVTIIAMHPMMVGPMARQKSTPTHTSTNGGCAASQLKMLLQMSMGSH